MNKKAKVWHIASWALGIFFFTIGILNAILVHIVPGIINLLISLIYLPPATAYFRKKLAFSMPVLMKIILAFIFIWVTLAVGDLFEMFEAWLNK